MLRFDAYLPDTILRLPGTGASRTFVEVTSVGRNTGLLLFEKTASVVGR